MQNGTGTLEADELMARIAALLGMAAVTVRWHLSVGRREMARVLGGPGGKEKP